MFTLTRPTELLNTVCSLQCTVHCTTVHTTVYSVFIGLNTPLRSIYVHNCVNAGGRRAPLACSVLSLQYSTVKYRTVLYSVQCALCSIDCSGWSVLCALLKQCTKFTEQVAIISVNCVLCSVRCVM